VLRGARLGRALIALDELALAAEPSAWERAGFAVRDGECVVGTVRLRLAGEAAGRGILGWSLRAAPAGEIDGLATASSPAPPPPGPEHPNAALGLDHVVVTTPDLERTTAALEDLGVRRRRVREAGQATQAFFRLGETILEVVCSSEVPAGPARFWGLVVTVGDLDALARRLGPALGEARPAVQPGRRIATARRSAGLGTRVAFMTPAAPR
jgi:hypothetical protein